MSAKQFVKSRYSGAFMCFNSDTATFKIYRDHQAWVALSHSCSSESGAWEDASSAILDREQVVTAVEVLDQR